MGKHLYKGKFAGKENPIFCRLFGTQRISEQQEGSILGKQFSIFFFCLDTLQE
jgi:hypothetical protein